MANEVQVVELTQPGWRISKRAVELVATELTSLIPHPNVIILQCMDNSTFFCQNEDGSLTLPVKALSDGKYHMVGDLRIATREQVNNLFNILKPLLSVITGAEVILVTCIPRYLNSSCCEKHCKWDKATVGKLKTDMTTMRRTIRSLLHAEKFGGVRLLDPIGICQCEEPSRYVDCVHLAGEEYEKLASAAVDCFTGQTGPIFGKSVPEAKRPRMASGPSEGSCMVG